MLSQPGARDPGAAREGRRGDRRARLSAYDTAARLRLGTGAPRRAAPRSRRRAADRGRARRPLTSRRLVRRADVVLSPIRRSRRLSSAKWRSSRTRVRPEEVDDLGSPGERCWLLALEREQLTGLCAGVGRAGETMALELRQRDE